MARYCDRSSPVAHLKWNANLVRYQRLFCRLLGKYLQLIWTRLLHPGLGLFSTLGMCHGAPLDVSLLQPKKDMTSPTRCVRCEDPRDLGSLGNALLCPQPSCRWLESPEDVETKTTNHYHRHHHHPHHQRLHASILAQRRNLVMWEMWERKTCGPGERHNVTMTQCHNVTMCQVNVKAFYSRYMSWIIIKSL